jgi:hypothetical protein
MALDEEKTTKCPPLDFPSVITLGKDFMGVRFHLG